MREIFIRAKFIAVAALSLLSNASMGQDAEFQDRDIEGALKKANQCIAARNYSCADINIRIAAQRSKTDSDRTLLSETKAKLSMEKLRAAAEKSVKESESSNFDEQIEVDFEASERRRNQRARQSNIMAEKAEVKKREDTRKWMAENPGRPPIGYGDFPSALIVIPSLTKVPDRIPQNAAEDDSATRESQQRPTADEQRLTKEHAESKARWDEFELKVREGCMKPENRGMCGCAKYHPPSPDAKTCGK